MKTHDEIKKGLGYHGWTLCDKECSYGEMKGTGYDCSSELCGDALIYIEQLETKCHQLERERDAAVEDIPRACGYCKWFEINRGGNMTECHNPNGCRNISGVNTGFEWRGVKEE